MMKLIRLKDSVSKSLLVVTVGYDQLQGVITSRNPTQRSQVSPMCMEMENDYLPDCRVDILSQTDLGDGFDWVTDPGESGGEGSDGEEGSVKTFAVSNFFASLFKVKHTEFAQT